MAIVENSRASAKVAAALATGRSRKAEGLCHAATQTEAPGHLVDNGEGMSRCSLPLAVVDSHWQVKHHPAHFKSASGRLPHLPCLEDLRLADGHRIVHAAASEYEDLQSTSQAPNRRGMSAGNASWRKTSRQSDELGKRKSHSGFEARMPMSAVPNPCGTPTPG